MTTEEKRAKINAICKEAIEKGEGCEKCKFEGNMFCANNIADDANPQTIDAWYASFFETPRIKDSGHRRIFETGAVRDMQEGKGRCDLLPLDIIANFLDDKIIHSIYKYATDGCVEWLYETIAYAKENFGTYSHIFLEVSKHFEEGAKKYGEYNWQKGIPTHCYVDSAIRHYLKWLRDDDDEPHGRAFIWNILCCIWTCTHKPELNDYIKENKDD